MPFFKRFPLILLLTYCLLLFNNSGYSQIKKYSYADSLRGYLNVNRSCYDVIYYDLEVEVNIKSKSISGSNEITLRSVKDFKRIQVDLFENMIIDSLTHDNHIATYIREGNAILIDFKDSIVVNSYEKIKIYFHGQPVISQNPPWDGGFIWSSDSLDRPWVGVACQGKGASLWWPNKDHLSDEPDSMQISIIAPNSLVAVSNGRLFKTSDMPGNLKKWIWNVTYPINNYNVTVNLGHYSHFSDEYSGINSGYSLDYYVLDYNLEKANSHFKQVFNMLESYEYYMGPYPYERDGFKLVESPFWGMEHQSCIAYGNEYYNEPLGFDYIIIHESGHEWWGNSVSTKDNGELWIHEAFTTYMESLFIEYNFGIQESINHLKDQEKLIENNYPITGPLSVNFDSWNDSDMYYKGSWMLHSIRNTIYDDDEWFRLLRKTYQHFQHKTITGNELIHFMNAQIGYNIDPIFRNFLNNKDKPNLKINFKRKKKGMRVTYHWKNVDNDFNMPTKIRCENNNWITIYPEIKKKHIQLECQDKSQIEFATDLFYHDVN